MFNNKWHNLNSVSVNFSDTLNSDSFFLSISNTDKPLLQQRDTLRLKAAHTTLSYMVKRSARCCHSYYIRAINRPGKTPVSAYSAQQNWMRKSSQQNLFHSVKIISIVFWYHTLISLASKIHKEKKIRYTSQTKYYLILQFLNITFSTIFLLIFSSSQTCVLNLIFYYQKWILKSSNHSFVSIWNNTLSTLISYVYVEMLHLIVWLFNEGL